MSLDQIDERVSELLKKGNKLEALGLLEQGIEIRRQVYGPQSEEVQSACAQLCEMCNTMASEYLERSDLQLSLDLLKRADFLSTSTSLKVQTLNNFGCYYRQTGKIRIAQNYLYKALGIQGDSASTHLNLCAVLSQLEKHDQALIHAMQAVIILQDAFINAKKRGESFEELAPMLAIAYLNTGVEHEHLKKTNEALKNYKKAEEFAHEHLGQTHPVTHNAGRAYQAAVKAASQSKNRSEKRKGKPKATNKNKNGYLSDEDIDIINKAWKSVEDKKAAEEDP